MISLKINIINDLLKDVSKFYAVKIPKQSINVNIFFQKGSKILRGKKKAKNIMLWRKKQEPWTSFLAILSHELGHTIEAKARAKITKIIKKNLLSRRYKASSEECEKIIGEAILRTLVPNGYLAVKYGLKDLNQIKPEISCTGKVRIIKTLKSKIMPITKNILERNKSIFSKKFLKQISDAYYKIII